MSQLIKLNVTNRGINLDLIKGAPVVYGFDVEDIVSPIRFNSNLSKCYFTARTIKDGANNSLNGAKVPYMATDTLATIATQSSMLLLLTVASRRGVVNNELQIFVTSKISENIIPVVGGGSKFFYMEDGDPLPVEYIVSEDVSAIFTQQNPTPVGGIPTFIIDTTWPTLNALKAANSLSKGSFYKITDRFVYQASGFGTAPNVGMSGDDRGFVYLQALETNKLSKEAVRIMACPLYYDSATHGSFVWEGVWHASKTTAIDHLMIWGGRVWQSVTGNIGTAVDDTSLDGVNWSLWSKEIPSPNLYADKQFSAIYDFDNDWFEQQWDGAGNKVGIDYGTNVFFTSLYNPCDATDWNFTSGSDGSVLMYENEQPLGILNNLSGFIVSNKANGVYSGILNNKTSSPIVGNASRVINNNNSGEISGNTLGISGLTSVITSCISDQVFNTATKYEITITGLTLLELSTHFPALNREITLKSTNATESLTVVNNFPQTDGKTNKAQIVRFYSIPALTITFVSGAGPNSPHCEGGINAIINGANGDWIELQRLTRSGGGIGAPSQINIGTY